MSAPIRGVMIVEDCNFCRATGEISKRPCRACSGSGALQRPATREEFIAFLGGLPSAADLLVSVGFEKKAKRRPPAPVIPILRR